MMIWKYEQQLIIETGKKSASKSRELITFIVIVLCFSVVK